MRTALCCAVAALFAAPAFAIDPRCDTETPWDMNAEYDASHGFQLCAPVTDMNLEALDVTELTTCTLDILGVGVFTQPASPGALVTFPPISSPTFKRTTATLFCSGPVEVGNKTTPLSIRLRWGKPDKPWWLRFLGG